MRPAPHRVAQHIARETLRAANRRTGGHACLFRDPAERARLDALCEALADTVTPLIDEIRRLREELSPERSVDPPAVTLLN